MVAGIVFMLVALAWLVFRRQIVAYQVRLATEKFKALPVSDKVEKARDLEGMAVPLCLLLFGAGALLTGFHLLFDWLAHRRRCGPASTTFRTLYIRGAKSTPFGCPAGYPADRSEPLDCSGHFPAPRRS